MTRLATNHDSPDCPNPFTSKLKNIKLGNLLAYAVLILLSFPFLYPLLRMVTISIMSIDDVMDQSINLIPRSLSFGNLEIAWRIMDPMRTIFNSIWFSGLLAIGTTLIATTTGYAFARFSFPFRKIWFGLAVIALILPTPVVLIPRLMMAMDITLSTGIRLIGTPWPQTIAAFLGQGLFSTAFILVFYNFVKMIPASIEEAAAIDGASPLQIFYHIALKLSVTTIWGMFLFSFILNWNETYATNIFLRGNLSLMTERLWWLGWSSWDCLCNFPDMVFGLEEYVLDEPCVRCIMDNAFRLSGIFVSLLPLFILYACVHKHLIRLIEDINLTEM